MAAPASLATCAVRRSGKSCWANARRSGARTASVDRKSPRPGELDIGVVELRVVPTAAEMHDHATGIAFDIQRLAVDEMCAECFEFDQLLAQQAGAVERVIRHLVDADVGEAELAHAARVDPRMIRRLAVDQDQKMGAKWRTVT